MTEDIQEDDVFLNYYNPVTRIKKDLEVGDIVWAKWKGVFWPALVQKCDKKQKKALVVYVDSPVSDTGKELRHKKNFKELVQFDNSPLSKELIDSEENNDRFKAVVQIAKDYVNKKSLGKLYISPLEFFRNPKNNVLADPNYRNATKRQVEGESEKWKSKNTSTKKRTKSCELPVPAIHFDPLTKDVKEIDEISTQITFNLGAKIKSSALSEECKDYLSQITEKKIANKRCDCYYNGTPKERKQLQYVFFSKILNDNQYGEIVTTFRDRTHSRGESNLCEIMNFIMDVMVPEALVFGMQKVLNISREKAEQVLDGADIPELDNERLIEQFGSELLKCVEGTDICTDTTT